MNLNPKLIYSENYNIEFYGLEKLHPFDSCKYGRAWNDLFTKLKKDKFDLRKITVEPSSKVWDSDITLVHGEEYALNDILDYEYLFRILELPFLSLMPPSVAKKIAESILESMKWATAGTILAAELALKYGIAVNMSGGYHHARKNHGSGFCVYSDIPIAINVLRNKNFLSQHIDKIIIIDLDAHQGDGFERLLGEDNDIFIMDIYNRDIYPGDEYSKKYIYADIPVQSGINDEQYLNILKNTLPDCLDRIQRVANSSNQPKLAFYNAGTDIYSKDPLGKLKVSSQGILSRDMYVISQLVAREIPCVMTLSGGYTHDSYRLVSNSLNKIVRKYHPDF
ncbi:MAG: histone deacetylase [Xenococcus sp. MO_188.B8]|nr:histone deacetylase [Xenococcus sp. MO_188.B8]